MARGNATGRSGIDRAIILRVAQQLLIRGPSEWAGRHARTQVSFALMSLRTHIAPPLFRQLIAAAHRVGKDIESAGLWHSEVPWLAEPVIERLRGLLPAEMPDEASARLALNLSNKVRCTQFLHPMREDWFEMINHALSQEEIDESPFDLDLKLSIAACIEDLLDQRLAQLVAHAEVLHDVTCADVEATLLQLLADSRANRATRPEQDAQATERVGLPHAALVELERLVAPGVAGAFRDWVMSLPPPAQRAVHRRVTGLFAKSPLAALWIKPIVAVSVSGLRELKVVADDVHYRILFYAREDGPDVVAFGLRRDLDDLICRAEAAGR